MYTFEIFFIYTLSLTIYLLILLVSLYSINNKQLSLKIFIIVMIIYNNQSLFNCKRIDTIFEISLLFV